MIRPAQHHDADAIFAFQLVHHLASAPANAAFVVRQRLVAHLDRAVVFFLRQSKDRLPRLQHLVREQLAIGKVQDRIDVLHVVLGKDVVFLGKGGLHRFRRRGHGRTRIRRHDLHQRRGQHVVHREEDDVQRLLAMLLLDQVVDVRNADLRREAGIDGAAARARPVEIGTGVVGINDVFRLHAQALQISVEQRRVGVDVEHARNADAELLAAFHERNALFRAPCSRTSPPESDRPHSSD